MDFPIDINRFIKLDLSLDKRLTNKDLDGLTKNIELLSIRLPIAPPKISPNPIVMSG